MADRQTRFHWHYNSDPVTHTTDLVLTEKWTGETEIKEMIAVSEGDRVLTQYIVIAGMEGVTTRG